MKIAEVINIIEEFAPTRYAADYDNVGLIVGDSQREVTAAVLCLDATCEVIERAKKLGANLIITHHPIIFNAIKHLTDSSHPETVVRQAIKSNIAIYACHTNLDSTIGGINYKFAEILGLEKVEILEKTGSDFGFGTVGELAKPMNFSDFIALVKEKFNLSVVKFSKPHTNTIKRVALCGGSGGSLINNAIDCNADVYVVGEMKFSDYFEAQNKITLLEIGHYESEICAIEILFCLLTKKMITFATHRDFDTNPVSYYI